MTSAANAPAWALRVHGSGRPLVLLHGFTGTGAAWDELLDGLGAGHRLIVPDLPGHGGTIGRIGGGRLRRARRRRAGDAA